MRLHLFVLLRRVPTSIVRSARPVYCGRIHVLIRIRCRSKRHHESNAGTHTIFAINGNTTDTIDNAIGNAINSAIDDAINNDLGDGNNSNGSNGSNGSKFVFRTPVKQRREDSRPSPICPKAPKRRSRFRLPLYYGISNTIHDHNERIWLMTAGPPAICRRPRSADNAYMPAALTPQRFATQAFATHIVSGCGGHADDGDDDGDSDECVRRSLSAAFDRV